MTVDLGNGELLSIYKTDARMMFTPSWNLSFAIVSQVSFYCELFFFRENYILIDVI